MTTFPTDTRQRTPVHALLSDTWKLLVSEGLAPYFDLFITDQMACPPGCGGKITLCFRDVPFLDCGADTPEEALAGAKIIVESVA